MNNLKLVEQETLSTILIGRGPRVALSLKVAESAIANHVVAAVLYRALE